MPLKFLASLILSTVPEDKKKFRRTGSSEVMAKLLTNTVLSLHFGSNFHSSGWYSLLAEDVELAAVAALSWFCLLNCLGGKGVLKSTWSALAWFGGGWFLLPSNLPLFPGTWFCWSNRCLCYLKIYYKPFNLILNK